MLASFHYQAERPCDVPTANNGHIDLNTRPDDNMIVLKMK